jgi:DNA helicase-2/ATP-dependent DNA helicase PcrA
MLNNPPDIFTGLNDSQKQAVTTINGPVLVVAGPGSGKTLTIVRRIAYLIDQGVNPKSILAVTFTNRAAREMRERTEALLGEQAKRVFIGTFHLLGLMLIREMRGGSFSLYNREEQIAVLKTLVGGSAKKAEHAAESISRIKNDLQEPDADIQSILDSYKAAMDRNAAYDFDDLISVPIDILSESSQQSNRKFTHIIVDEYQDINPSQYRFLHLLAQNTMNICAVGDPDQAIYAFRGADLRNFLNFEQDHPGASRIVLSKNYRSTATILRASDSLIRNNQQRIRKELIPTREQGVKISVTSAPDDRAEAEAIISEIESRIGGTSHAIMRQQAMNHDRERSYRFSDFAVIFRTNAQAKVLEDAFRESGIPYQLVGRRSKTKSREIEETIAYLKSFLRHDEAGGHQRGDAMEEKLLAPADLFDPRADAVALMTMHMAKGLEFPVVFIAGCVDGIVPLKIMKDGFDIEEERRLFYVGMTRAKDELHLLHARKQFLFGQTLSPARSSFINEMPQDLLAVAVLPDRKEKRKTENKQMGLF